MDISLVTPTHDRHLAFALCERWMARALSNFKDGQIQWVVADDGTVPVHCTMGQEHVREERFCAESTESFIGNMCRALERVRHDVVFIIEDDDWYGVDYFNNMLGLFGTGADIVGEGRARYYHVPSRQYHVHGNVSHCSWCQTAFRAEHIPFVIELATGMRTAMLDKIVWDYLPGRKFIKESNEWSVGIKGLGMGGVGAGHDSGWYRRRDESGSVLREWVGVDAEIYFEVIDKLRRGWARLEQSIIRTDIATLKFDAAFFEQSLIEQV